MLKRTSTWTRPNEEQVKFRGFSKDELTQIYPALQQTDKYLKDTKRLNATFKKSNPIYPKRSSPRVAAETRYFAFGGKAKVYVNPEVFGRNKYQWNPSGVVSHEIGHLVGPTRNSKAPEHQAFRRAFSYRQKKWYHEQAPQLWNKRRDNPLRGSNTRQAVDASEDFAETWRHLTGVPFTNRTNTDYFSVITTPQRVNYMKRYVMK